MQLSKWNARGVDIAAIVGVVVLCIVARLLPHPPNFTPVGAFALFAGAHWGGRRLAAILIPVSAMVISDMFLGMHALALVVYASIAGYGLLGMLVQRRGPVAIGAASLAGSTLFFLVTNFAVWMQHYEWSLAGLARCFTAAIPFYGNTVAGDLVFTAIIFGAAALANARVMTGRKQSAAM